jgi:subtilisin family serine protease
MKYVLSLLMLLSMDAWAQTKPKLLKVPQYLTSTGTKLPKLKSTNTQMIKIAIIDTGYDASISKSPLKLCQTGHYDYLSNTPVVGSAHPHGTVVASVIAEMLTDVNYCAVIYQVVTPMGLTADAIMNAFDRARSEGISAVNLSISGRLYSWSERRAMEATAKAGTVIFTAAGNERTNLDKFCNAYPACYPIQNMYVVGATERDNTEPTPYTNYGKVVDVWMPGDYEILNEVVEGTSFAAPRALAFYVYALSLVLK